MVLNYKMLKVYEGEMLCIFYGYEGKYNEECVGLYKISYILEVFVYLMNDFEMSGLEIMNIMYSYVDVVYLLM